MFFDIYSQLCKQKGVSCKKAAMDIGYSGATATRWKNGSTPNGETLKKLATYFGVTAEYLLNGDETKKSPTAEGEGLNKTGYSDLTDKNKEIINAMIETLLKQQGS